VPISFPIPDRGALNIRADNLPFIPSRMAGAAYIPVSVFASRRELSKPQKNVVTTPCLQPNQQSFGVPFQARTNNAIVNPVNEPFTINTLPFTRVMGVVNMVLSGVSRDSAGATLGLCRVMIFRTEDKAFVMETTSDASGNWSVSLLVGGPFFLVEYLAGAPDRAGTSLNTLAPAVV
jgi:hypothetical protein